MKSIITKCLVSCLLFSPIAFFSLTANPVAQAEVTQSYQARDFSYLLGIKGLSDETLNLHFKLYQGYVTHVNLIFDLLNQYTREGKQNSPQFQELKRRLGWEWDGMRLHELYFSNLTKTPTPIDPNSQLAKQIKGDFNTFEQWKEDFIATGMLRGIGWVILYQDPITGRLFNTWIEEHDIGHLAGGKPILVMDVWEHAYLLDYKTDRKAYITTFFDHIDWNVVSKRYP